MAEWLTTYSIKNGYRTYLLTVHTVQSTSHCPMSSVQCPVRYGTVRSTVREVLLLYCTILYCTGLYCTVLYGRKHGRQERGKTRGAGCFPLLFLWPDLLLLLILFPTNIPYPTLPYRCLPTKYNTAAILSLLLLSCRCYPAILFPIQTWKGMSPGDEA